HKMPIEEAKDVIVDVSGNPLSRDGVTSIDNENLTVQGATLPMGNVSEVDETTNGDTVHLITATEAPNHASRPEAPMVTRREYSVSLSEKVTVPPRHQVLCLGRIDKRAPPGLYVSEPREIGVHGVLVARTLFERQANHAVAINLINVSPQPVVVEARTPVATARSACSETHEPTPLSNMLVATLSCESRQTLEAIDLSHINEKHRGKFKEFLLSYADIFASKSKKLGATPLVKHRIETSSDVPVARAPYK
ncbi:hypothetical protein CBL_21346, partial [Carabus blaptoides fortunei]